MKALYNIILTIVFVFPATSFAQTSFGENYMEASAISVGLDDTKTRAYGVKLGYAAEDQLLNIKPYVSLVWSGDIGLDELPGTNWTIFELGAELQYAIHLNDRWSVSGGSDVFWGNAALESPEVFIGTVQGITQTKPAMKFESAYYGLRGALKVSYKQSKDWVYRARLAHMLWTHNANGIFKGLDFEITVGRRI